MSRTTAARLTYVALFGAIGASFPYLGVYYQSIGVNLEHIGLLTSTTAAAGLVASPLWGTVADRFATSRLVLPMAALLAAAAATILALAREPIPIVAAVIAMALGMAGIAPILDARALETVRRDRDRYGRLRAWGSGSFIVVTWLTGALIERAGAPSLFIVYVPLLLAAAVVTLPLKGDGAGLTPLPRLQGVREVIRQPALRRFLVAALLTWSALMAINWYFSIHLLALGAPGELVGAAWAVGAIVEIPIMWAYPWLASRLGTERILVLGAAVLALRAIAILLLRDPALVTATMVLHGIGFALLLVGGVTYVSRHAPPAATATAQGILTAVAFSLAMIIGPGIGAVTIGTWGVPAMFGMATLGAGLSVLMMALALRGRVAVSALERPRVPSGG